MAEVKAGEGQPAGVGKDGLSMEDIAPPRVTAARAPAPTATTTALFSATEPRPPGWLTPSEQDGVAVLGQRDREVRQAEYERLTDAGVRARVGIDYEYRVGPDSRRYVVQAHPGMVAALAPATDEAERPPPDLWPERNEESPPECGQSLDVSV